MMRYGNSDFSSHLAAICQICQIAISLVVARTSARMLLLVRDCVSLGIIANALLLKYHEL